MIDETTDVSIVKEMVIYGLYLVKVCSGFLAINELSDCTAETIEKIL